MTPAQEVAHWSEQLHYASMMLDKALARREAWDAACEECGTLQDEHRPGCSRPMREALDADFARRVTEARMVVTGTQH